VTPVIPRPVVVAPVAPAAPNTVNPPPEDDIPAVPSWFVPPNPRDFMGYRPTSRETAAASTAISNLANADNWVATFGSSVPSPATLTSALTLGLQWGEMRASTTAWDVYVKAQYAMAWKRALILLEDLKPVFLCAIAKNSALASQYEGFAQMFDAQKLVARQAIATRKRNAKAKAAATVEAAVTTQAAAPAAPAPAPVQAPAVTPAPTGKSITVTA
jgi:hypothetical protein